MGTATITFDGTNAPTSCSAPQDGDAPIAAADVTPGIQAAGDTAWNALLRVQPLATIAALKAILVPTAGMVRFVTGYGLYHFVTSGGPQLLAVEPWAVAPTDLTAGKWIHENAYERLGGTILLPQVYRTVHPASLIGATAATAVRTHLPTIAVGGAGITVTPFGVQFASANPGSTPVHHAVWDLTPTLVPFQGARLDGVDLRLDPASGVHAGLPLVMPGGYVYRVHYSTAALDSLRSTPLFVDSSASVAAYEAQHDVGAVLDQNNVIDTSTYHYFLVFTNEGHTNAEPLLKIDSIRLWMGPA